MALDIDSSEESRASLGHAVIGADSTDARPVPRLLVATTVQVYFLPGVSVFNPSGLAAPVFPLGIPPFDDRQTAL
jgi:hypothetical protein